VRTVRTHRSAWASAFGAWTGVSRACLQRVMPDQGGGQGDPGQVVDRALVVAGGDPAELLEPHRVDGEVVAGDDPSGLLTQERTPRRGPSSWYRVKPMAAQRGADPGCRDPHAEAQQLALDALVAPARVLLGQADDELLDLLVELGSARSAVGIGPGAGEEPSVPAQERLGLHKEARPAGAGNTRLTQASRARSAGWSLGRATWRRSIVSWWRRTRISRSLAASVRASSTGSWMERQSVR
jgi:hypothetical protein